MPQYRVSRLKYLYLEIKRPQRLDLMGTCYLSDISVSAPKHLIGVFIREARQTWKLVRKLKEFNSDQKYFSPTCGHSVNSYFRGNLPEEFAYIRIYLYEI